MTSSVNCQKLHGTCTNNFHRICVEIRLIGPKLAQVIVRSIFKASLYTNKKFNMIAYKCIKKLFYFYFSIFVWSNESINIWSHLLGFLIFLLLMVYDNLIILPRTGSSFSDYFVVSLGLLCYQVCKFKSQFNFSLLSLFYLHTFYTKNFFKQIIF